MNNEEILSQILENQKQMQHSIMQVQENQKQMQDCIMQMQKNITSTQDDVRVIKVKLENEISPAISTLCSMQQENSKRLRNLEEGYEKITDDIVISEVINGLKENKLI